MICELVRQGKKVGITATSHKVIQNLLGKVIEAANEADIKGMDCIQKVNENPDAALPGITFTTDNAEPLAALRGGTQVAGGTAWLWSRGVEAQPAVFDGVLQRELGGATASRRARAGSAPGRPACGAAVPRCVEPLDGAVDAPRRLQDLDDADLRGQRRRPATFGDRQASVCSRLSSSTSAATSSVMLGRAARCAPRTSAAPPTISRLSAILMLTSLSEQSTPAELSMKSVLMRPPAQREFDAPRLGDAQIGALADHPGADLPPLTRCASLAGSPTSALFSWRAFT